MKNEQPIILRKERVACDNKGRVSVGLEIANALGITSTHVIVTLLSNGTIVIEPEDDISFVKKGGEC